MHEFVSPYVAPFASVTPYDTRVLTPARIPTQTPKCLGSSELEKEHVLQQFPGNNSDQNDRKMGGKDHPACDIQEA